MRPSGPPTRVKAREMTIELMVRDSAGRSAVDLVDGFVDALFHGPVDAEPVRPVPPAAMPRTAAGQRAVARRRARVTADRRPPSGVLPSGVGRSAVVTAERGDRLQDRSFTLGRWPRLLCTLTALAAAVLMVLSALPALSGASSPGVAAVTEVTVGAGDSLWSIAQQADPGADPRTAVQRIRTLNGLQSDAVSEGVVLKVPGGHR